METADVATLTLPKCVHSKSKNYILTPSIWVGFCVCYLDDF